MNPPTSTYVFGVYGRTIKSAKEVICRMINNKLLTVFTEIETIVNNHSLTQGSHNCEDTVALALLDKYKPYSRRETQRGTKKMDGQTNTC